jgi:cyclopropane-fatty-acyl-phospholipid synthase
MKSTVSQVAFEHSPLTGWQRLLRGQLVKTLVNLEGGRVRLIDVAGEVVLGDGGPVVTVEVTDPAFYAEVTFGGTVGAGESYVAGHWRSDDLVGLVRLLLRNRRRLDAMEGGLALLRRGLEVIFHRLRSNSTAGSRRNISAHYDMGNDLFEQFLDARLMYSSAVYENDNDDLETASAAKLERICQKLELGPHDHLLEIGTGWGGLAVYAAQRSGCRVTTTTISREQHTYAVEKARAAGLENQITVLEHDYRELDGVFSKAVSVEMVEAVGYEYLDRFFAVCEQRLAPGGLFLLQAITIDDALFDSAVRSVDFIKKHVFPGSFIPSVSALVGASARSNLVLTNLEDMGADYAKTLAAWRARFVASSGALAAAGYDQRFQRLWEFYLCYCEGGFRERSTSDVQMLFAKQGYRGQPFRSRLIETINDEGVFA